MLQELQKKFSSTFNNSIYGEWVQQMKYRIPRQVSGKALAIRSNRIFLVKCNFMNSQDVTPKMRNQNHLKQSFKKRKSEDLMPSPSFIEEKRESRDYLLQMIPEENLQKRNEYDVEISPKSSQQEFMKIKFIERGDSENEKKEGSSPNEYFQRKLMASRTALGSYANIRSTDLDFDQLGMFKHFFPMNNYDLVIKRYSRIQRYLWKKRQHPDNTFYSFFNISIRRGLRLRKQMAKEQSKSKSFNRQSYAQQQFQSKQSLLVKGVSQALGWKKFGTRPFN